ncbi:hypothetical protein JEQ12_008989 [Ovis aries]|uniref:ATP synthase peripheral stalk subunit F6, mitochondrial n=1 Tax=Ovis aries TaxID=9940 RepID=A0A836D5B4_SHEEP|nr:hypothetical protein JEQ12_008989 [Ovis aries]
MILQRLFRSTVIQSAVLVSLRRNIGVTAVASNKELDPVRELFKLDRIYGKADTNTFPNFTFEDPKFKVIEKPQS